jgi:hypothetical protein
VYGNENSIDGLAVARHGPHEPIEVRRTTGTDRATRHVVRELRRTTFQDAFEKLEPLFASSLVCDLTGALALIVAFDDLGDAASVNREHAVGPLPAIDYVG